MSKVVGDTFIIELEGVGECELCGAIAELRPYGPNGENICFECGKKDIETVRKKFYERIQNCDLIEIRGGI